MNSMHINWFDRRTRPPRKEVVARVVLSILGLATSALSLSAKATFTHAMLVAGGWPARASIIVMGVLGVVLLTETMLNDVLPSQFSFDWGRHHRQFMWMALGLIFELFAYQVFTASLSTSLGTYLVIYGFGSFLLAFIDAASEKMDRRRWEA